MNCEFLTGVAGSGKSYSVMEQIKKDPSWGLMTATTGIAAINLGMTTLASTLGYFDTQSLREIQKTGQLNRRLWEIKKKYHRLGIDEVSMLDGDQLTILVEECAKCWLGLYITGDFLQLPPVKAKWAFESPAWSQFEANTTRLTKVYRQTEAEFLNCLNFARSGNGRAAAGLLPEDAFHETVDDGFDGTTLISKNDDVNDFNRRALERLPGTPFMIMSRKWGKARGEWKNIPEFQILKIGAYVMLLSNKYREDDEEEKGMEYANGDCGHIRDWNGETLEVELIRNGETVRIEPLLRDSSKSRPPKPWFSPAYGHGEWLPKAHWIYEKEKFVEGQIEYFPVRLAYASTIHRSQGLSLDSVQFDCRDRFVASPAMAYVAMSRCRTMAGLRIVGDRETLIRHCNVDPKVKRWL